MEFNSETEIFRTTSSVAFSVEFLSGWSLFVTVPVSLFVTVPVRGPSAHPAAAGFDLVRGFARVAQTERRSQIIHHHRSHHPHACYGGVLPVPSAQQIRPAHT